ncbi:hypothetical protein EPI10_028190 [Gossypium australe]|uniref:Uncharacterized protein n=1 Tax=Gossypium australe TaxID=47621 RepID=A0A5B6UZU5_9ROSI|nr:hypothetical protein EPI10_028190 [Gossypium australe]
MHSFTEKHKEKKSLGSFAFSATCKLKLRSRTEENRFRSRESESIRVVKATEGSGPSQIVITLIYLFWYTLELYKARNGMYRLVFWYNLFCELSHVIWLFMS